MAATFSCVAPVTDVTQIQGKKFAMTINLYPSVDDGAAEISVTSEIFVAGSVVHPAKNDAHFICGEIAYVSPLPLFAECTYSADNI